MVETRLMREEATMHRFRHSPIVRTLSPIGCAPERRVKWCLRGNRLTGKLDELASEAS